MNNTVVEQQTAELLDNLFVKLEVENNQVSAICDLADFCSIEDANEYIVSIVGEPYIVTKVVSNFDVTEFMTASQGVISITDIYEEVFDVLDMNFGRYAAIASWVEGDGMRIGYNTSSYISLFDESFLFALDDDNADEQLGKWFIDNHTNINQEKYADIIKPNLDLAHIATALMLTSQIEIKKVDCRFDTQRTYYFKQ